jgi:UDP-N-acetyl-D-galactosamine dehydrogenase
MYNKLINKETKLSVIGLGYVGLPIALEFAKQIKVVGFDIKPERVALMKKGIDPSNELTSGSFSNTDIVLTSDPADLKEASFHIIAVPTPHQQATTFRILLLCLKLLRLLGKC